MRAHKLVEILPCYMKVKAQIKFREDSRKLRLPNFKTVGT